MVSKKQQPNERAKEAVLEEWHRWKPDHPKGMMSGLMFYNYLSNEKSELLKFEKRMAAARRPGQKLRHMKKRGAVCRPALGLSIITP